MVGVGVLTLFGAYDSRPVGVRGVASSCWAGWAGSLSGCLLVWVGVVVAFLVVTLPPSFGCVG